MAPMIGRTFSHYRILEKLGEGGMGEVYRAEDTRLGREVAVKVLPPDVVADAERLERFRQEARAVAALSHPSILGIFDFGSTDDITYAVMELLEGGTLRERLAGGRIPVRRALDYALQIARGLAAAHEKGIVHRDLKPDNIFITRDGQVKILDFGIAKVRPLGPIAPGEPTLPLTHEGMVLGTVGYMAPEQVRGDTADLRADVFSLGVVLFEMLAGRPPFRGESAVETMHAILKEDPPEITLDGVLLEPEVDRLVRHCLEKDPGSRFQSARDLVFALESAALGSGPRTATRAPRRSGRTARKAVAVVSLLAAAVVAGAMLQRFAFRAPGAAGEVSFSALTYSGSDRSPTASRDGRMIAFASDRDGRSRIWIKQLGGGEAALTDGTDDFPRFSPDGSQVLFARSEAGRASLYRKALVGGAPRKLLDDASYGDWSPDGQRVAFIRWSMEDGQLISILGVANADGAEATEIARFEGSALAHPRWSPDGSTIAATPVGATQQPVASPAIFLVAADGSSEETIAAPGSFRSVSSATWSGSHELIYVQAESVVQAAGSVARILRQDTRSGRILADLWSPSSSGVVDLLHPAGIVFDARSPRENLHEVTLTRDAPSSPRWLSRGNSTDRQPVYSPDGEWVLFSSNRGGNLDLWSISRTTGEVRRITDDSASDWDPAFLPASEGIVWSTDRAGHFECWVADADGSNARRLTHDGVDAENPTATADGAWIVYASTNPDGPGLWKIRPDGTEPMLLLSGNPNLPEVSPDGRHALYTVSESANLVVLRVVRIEDGEHEPFTIRIEQRRATPAALGRARWMPDGRAIAFVGQDATGVNGIFVQDFVPGEDTSSSRRPLGGFDRQVATESFGVSPDGKRLVIAAWEQLFTIMRADGVVPETSR
jgi:serine/threonine protein kinase